MALRYFVNYSHRYELPSRMCILDLYFKREETCINFSGRDLQFCNVFIFYVYIVFESVQEDREELIK